MTGSYADEVDKPLSPETIAALNREFRSGNYARYKKPGTRMAPDAYEARSLRWEDGSVLYVSDPHGRSLGDVRTMAGQDQMLAARDHVTHMLEARGETADNFVVVLSAATPVRMSVRRRNGRWWVAFPSGERIEYGSWKAAWGALEFWWHVGTVIPF